MMRMSSSSESPWKITVSSSGLITIYYNKLRYKIHTSDGLVLESVGLYAVKMNSLEDIFSQIETDTSTQLPMELVLYLTAIYEVMNKY